MGEALVLKSDLLSSNRSVAFSASNKFSDLDRAGIRELGFNRRTLPGARLGQGIDRRRRRSRELRSDARRHDVENALLRLGCNVAHRLCRVRIPERFVDEVIVSVATAIDLS